MSETFGEPMQSCDHTGCSDFLHRKEYCQEIELDELEMLVGQTAAMLDTLLLQVVGEPRYTPDAPGVDSSDAVFFIDGGDARFDGVNHHHHLRIDISLNDYLDGMRMYEIQTMYESNPLVIPSQDDGFPLFTYYLTSDAHILNAEVSEPDVVSEDFLDMYNNQYPPPEKVISRRMSRYDFDVLQRLITEISTNPGE